MKFTMLANSILIRLSALFFLCVSTNFLGCSSTTPDSHNVPAHISEQSLAQSTLANKENDIHPFIESLPDTLRKYPLNIYFWLEIRDRSFLLIDQNSDLILFHDNLNFVVLDHDVHPFCSLSHDKKKIAYTRFVDGRGTGKIYIYNLVQNKKISINDDIYAEGPVFFPDDSGLLYVSGKTSIASFYRYQFYMSQTHQLTNIGMVSGSGLPLGFQPVPSDYQSYRWEKADNGKPRLLAYRSDEKTLRLNPYTGETQWP